MSNKVKNNIAKRVGDTVIIYDDQSAQVVKGLISHIGTFKFTLRDEEGRMLGKYDISLLKQL